MRTRLVAVGDAELEVLDRGVGEPVVLVQTGLTADELLPLASDPALAEGYRKIVYHRRGYAGSSPVGREHSIVRDAGDCAALLDALGIERAHVVGFSYSGAVALQMAADHTGRTGTLTLLEPPPVHTPSAPEFRRANDRLIRSREEAGADAALDELLALLLGPDWRDGMDDLLPGATAQMARDAVTFFDADIPALLDWRFGQADAGRITCPVLHVAGSDSGPWFAEVRELVLRWLPHAEDVVVDGADHSLVLTRTSEVAGAVAGFLHRHPLDGRDGRN